MELLWGIFATVMSVLGSSWYCVVTHEWSHYLAGRAAGVPSRNIKVRMRPNPPHVALYNEDEWLTPDQPQYVQTFQAYQPRTVWAWFYIAAGTLGQLVAALAAVAVLRLFDLTIMAIILLGTSVAFTLIYLIGDAVVSRKHRSPAGDFSSMWQITRSATAIMTVGVIILYGALIVTIVLTTASR